MELGLTVLPAGFFGLVEMRVSFLGEGDVLGSVGFVTATGVSTSVAVSTAAVKFVSTCELRLPAGVGGDLGDGL